MNFKLMARRYMGPADDGSDLGGGVVDRGDNFQPTDDEVQTKEAPVVEAAVEQEVEADTEKNRDDKGRFTGKGIIPVEQHKKVLDRERAAREAAERRADELERQIKSVDSTADIEKIEAEIVELEDKIESARLDGNKEEIKRLNNEIRIRNRQISVNQSTQMTERAKEQAREEIRLDLTIERTEELYPMLNADNEAYDQDAVDLVLATQRDLIERMRMPPSKALAEAARKVMAKLIREEAADDDGEEAKGLKNADKTSDRKKEQIRKNIDAANKQPASMKSVGLDSDKAGQDRELADASVMSFEEFSALPEATKAKMRGDYV